MTVITKAYITHFSLPELSCENCGAENLLYPNNCHTVGEPVLAITINPYVKGKTLPKVICCNCVGHLSGTALGCPQVIADKKYRKAVLGTTAKVKLANFEWGGLPGTEPEWWPKN